MAISCSSSHKGFLAFCGLFIFTVLCGIILAAPHTAADSSGTVDLTITVPSTCTLTTTVNTAHTASVTNGTYESGIGETTLKTVCNDGEGFAIYAVGYTDDTFGNNVLAAASPLDSTSDVPTGTATSGSTSNWAMMLTAVSGTYTPTIENGFSSYHVVPDEYTKVASFASTTDATIGASIKNTFAVYMKDNQPAGTYNGKVKFALVHPSSASAPRETNLIMQEVSTWGSSVTTGTEVLAKDSRDGTIYTVARLADGNLWMTQNLDLDIDSSTTYTSADTDISANWTPARSTYTTGDTTWGLYDENEDYYYGYEQPESYDPGDVYWNGNLYPTTQSACESAGGTWYTNWGGYCDDAVLTSSTGDYHYHLGNYYNWTAALAMNDNSAYDSGGTLVDQSICPAGWTLPRAGTGEDSFYALMSNASYDFLQYDEEYDESYLSSISETTNMWSSPLFFSLTGVWNGSLYGVSDYGYFWSPVVYNSDGAYGADLGSDGYAYPSGSSYRLNGASVRCLARPVSSMLVDAEGDSGGGDW